MKKVKLFVLSAIFVAVALVVAPQASAQSLCQDCPYRKIDAGSDGVSIVVQNGGVMTEIVKDGVTPTGIYVSNNIVFTSVLNDEVLVCIVVQN